MIELRDVAVRQGDFELRGLDLRVEPGEYAVLMRYLATRELRTDHYLKAAKRAFNYLRAIGDLEGMAAITPLFATPEARVGQYRKVLEALAMALDPATSSQILSVAAARDQLREAGAVVKADLPIIPGTNPKRGEWVAEELDAIAAALRGRTSDAEALVEPDADLANRLDTMLEVEIAPIIRLSLRSRVKDIIEAYVP